jgi:PAS domain S-box-containing protein
MLVALWAMVVVATHSSRETASMLVGVASVMTLLVVGGAVHLIREIRQWAAHAVELQDAVDSISEAFVIFDRDDLFVACNEAYRRHIYPDTNEHLKPGTRFEDVVRHGVNRGKYAGAIGREEEWIAERVAAHRNLSGSIEQWLTDGSCLLISERRMRSGGTAGLRIDITELKRREAELRDALRSLDDVQRIAGLGSMKVDIATEHIEWSAGVCAIFGVARETVEPTFDYIRSFIHPDDAAVVNDAALTSHASGVAPAPLEYRIVRPDGSVRVVYRQNEIKHDAAGRPVTRVLTFKDITEYKRKESQLQRAVEQLDRVQRIAGIGHTTMSLRTGLFEWSAGARAIFGIGADDIEPSVDFFRRLVHPADRDKVRHAAEKAARDGAAAPPLEYRIIRTDGAIRTVYRENAIECDASGRPAFRIVTFRDITELKNAEAQMREMMSNLERAQHLAHMGTDVWDLRSGVVTWSPEIYRIIGVDPATFVPTAENFLDLVVPEDRSEIGARGDKIQNGNAPGPVEYSVHRPDGDIRHIYSEGEIVRDETGQPLRWVAMRQDITEYRRVERSLREAKDAAEAANVAKSQFLANMSHELRTPLNAVIGFSEFLEAGFAGPVLPRQQEYINLIRQSGDHLNRVINEILDLAKIDAGKLELREEAGIEPAEIAKSCIDLIGPQAKERGIHLSVETDRQLPQLVADKTRLTQILLNLLSNAVKFAGPDGLIEVSVRRAKPAGIAFRVRDSGPGMTAAEIEVALQPFGQIDAGLGRRHEGTGLGLPLAQRFAALHGGSLHITSSKGSGTTVTVTLPAERMMDRPRTSSPEVAA